MECTHRFDAEMSPRMPPDDEILDFIRYEIRICLFSVWLTDRTVERCFSNTHRKSANAKTYIQSTQSTLVFLAVRSKRLLKFCLSCRRARKKITKEINKKHQLSKRFIRKCEPLRKCESFFSSAMKFGFVALTAEKVLALCNQVCKAMMKWQRRTIVLDCSRYLNNLRLKTKTPSPVSTRLLSSGRPQQHPSIGTCSRIRGSRGSAVSFSLSQAAGSVLVESTARANPVTCRCCQTAGLGNSP